MIYEWGQLIKGDNLEVLKTFEDNSIDSIVTDPPSFIGFQGLEWDNKGDRSQAVDWLQKRLTEAFRVLKPGGFAVIWCLPRTSHYSMMATEEAGFNIVSVVSHFYGQGTPKGLNLEKAVAKIEPDRANEFTGQNSSIKPACEFWVLAQKPISEKTIALNALKWGTGGLNIDKCRVSTTDNLNGGAYAKEGTERDDGWGFQRGGAGEYKQPEGRFPPNLLFTHHPDCKLVGTREVKTGTAIEPDSKDMNRSVYGKTKTLGRECGFGQDGKETIPLYECAEGCPISELDDQVGELKSGSNCVRTKAPKFLNNVGCGKPGDIQKTYGDKGGASRFFPNFEWTEQDVKG